MNRGTIGEKPPPGSLFLSLSRVEGHSLWRACTLLCRLFLGVWCFRGSHEQDLFFHYIFCHLCIKELLTFASFCGLALPLTSIVSDGFSVAFLQFRRPEFMSSANTNTASSCPSSCASPGTMAGLVRSLGRLVWTEVSSSILTHNAAFWLAAYRHIFFLLSC